MSHRLVFLRSPSRREIVLSTVGLLPAACIVGARQWQPAPGQTQTPAASQPGQVQAPAAQAGQTQPATPTFSTGVKVVNVFATVRDKDGKIVRDLTKEDFALEEDGRPQSIRYFSQQTDLPLTLGLLVDTSQSERRMLGTERDASDTFFRQVLRPDKDKAFLIHFDREVELLQDLTASREKLEKALDQIDKPQWGNGDSGPSGDSGGQGGGGGYGHGGGGRGGSGGRGYGGHGGTALYDAIYLASDDLMSKQTGRKALILLTDGEDRNSKISLSEAITSAQRADTLAYSVRIADDEPSHSFGGPGMGGRHGGWGGGGMGGGRGRGGSRESRPDGKKILQQISKQTGGSYFEVSKKKTVDQIYTQIEEELRNQYSLGYTSDQTGSGVFRKIQLTVKQKGLTVQTRDGYYAT
ncbi:MAG TPA: VWA domain-containing protein [Bryobacteraceae bacterium]|nr:VWA domain-containing protein [Bryobacteraceae bacterium]